MLRDTILPSEEMFNDLFEEFSVDKKEVEEKELQFEEVV